MRSHLIGIWGALVALGIGFIMVVVGIVTLIGLVLIVAVGAIGGFLLKLRGNSGSGKSGQL